MQISKISTQSLIPNNNLNKHSSFNQKPIHSTKYDDLNSLDILAKQKLPFVSRPSCVQKISFGANPLKVPEFLYHVTTKGASDLILKAGKIITHAEPDTGLKGVFTFDIENFANKWGVLDADGRRIDSKLIGRISIGDGIVLFKIPTSTLKKDDLRARSQNLVFDCISKQQTLFREDISEEERASLLNFLKTNRSHLRNAVPVKEAGDFAQDAIEFIYPNDIAVDESMILGTASLSDYFFGKEEMAKGAFRKLTEGKTEAKFF